MEESWVQVISIIGSIIGAVGGSCVFLSKQINDYRKEMREDIKIQAARSDRLYEMFIDLLKEGRK